LQGNFKNPEAPINHQQMPTNTPSRSVTIPGLPRPWPWPSGGLLIAYEAIRNAMSMLALGTGLGTQLASLI
jgi:hypothetical protein